MRPWPFKTPIIFCFGGERAKRKEIINMVDLHFWFSYLVVEKIRMRACMARVAEQSLQRSGKLRAWDLVGGRNDD
jgi:hypothetical protein